MKGLGCLLLVIVLICGIGYGSWWYFFHHSSDLIETETEEETEEESESRLFDKNPTPERLAEVLGSQEAYEELRNSDLIKMKDFGNPESNVPDIRKTNMYIVHDSSGIWVYVTLEGEIASLDLNSKKLVLKNGKDEILLRISEFGFMNKMIWTDVGVGQPPRYIPWEELKVGDWLNSVTVLINAKWAEIRNIHIY